MSCGRQTTGERCPRKYPRGESYSSASIETELSTIIFSPSLSSLPMKRPNLLARWGTSCQQGDDIQGPTDPAFSFLIRSRRGDSQVLEQDGDYIRTRYTALQSQCRPSTTMGFSPSHELTKKKTQPINLQVDSVLRVCIYMRERERAVVVSRQAVSRAILHSPSSPQRRTSRRLVFAICPWQRVLFSIAAVTHTPCNASRGGEDEEKKE